jgi:hypothetical protein
MINFILQYLKDNIKKDLMAVIIISLFAFIVIRLASCQPSNANIRTFFFQTDSIFKDGIVWVNPIGPDTVVFSWGIDSVLIPYNQLDGMEIDIPEGQYQFHVYPLHKPKNTPYLLYEWWMVYEITAEKIIEIMPKTDYFLVLLDTINTWDFNTGYKNLGYQYLYYLASDSTYFPIYQMDYYCGTKGQDSTLMIFRIDSAKYETIYFVKCLQSYMVKVNVNLQYVFSDVETTYHYK